MEVLKENKKKSREDAEMKEKIRLLGTSKRQRLRPDDRRSQDLPNETKRVTKVRVGNWY